MTSHDYHMIKLESQHEWPKTPSPEHNYIVVPTRGCIPNRTPRKMLRGQLEARGQTELQRMRQCHAEVPSDEWPLEIHDRPNLSAD